MSRKVLITGGAGFIGYHLCKKLLDEGYNIIAVDDLSTGSIENINRLKKHKSFKFVQGKAENKSIMENLVKNADIIFHLAATVGVKNVINNPVQTIENNIESTSLILKLSSKSKKRVFIFSTSEVYGKSKKIPFKEEDNLVIGSPAFKRWSYSISKLLDESLALSYYENNKLNVTVVRLFNTIGKHQKSQYGMVVPNFIKEAIKGEPLQVFGNGQQTRSFTDVRDTIKFLSALIDNKNSYGEILNIGGGNEISIEELASKVRKITNSNSIIQKISYDVAYGKGYEEMPRRVPCSKKLKDMTGICFSHSLDDTLKWIEESIRAETLRNNSKEININH